MRTDVSPALPRCNHPALGAEGKEDHEFVFMLDAFRATGGLARADEIAAVLRGRQPDHQNVLARWIAAHEVVYLQWGGDYWLPLFQFRRGEMTPKPWVRRVLAQLGSVFDAWEVALWFARSNPWLEGAIPAGRLDIEPFRVEQAARADRFAAGG